MKLLHIAGLLFALFALLVMSGCAMLPMPLQPRNTQGFNSAPVEITWAALDAVDTLQTMHLERHTNAQPFATCDRESDPIAAHLYGTDMPPPGRVLAVNMLLMSFHMMVASWLDDRVAAESARNDAGEDSSLGPWYVARVGFYAASFLYSANAVRNNIQHGCRL